MYNTEQKERYLRYCNEKFAPGYTENARSMFNKTEPFEEMFGRDIAEFTYDQISDFYSMAGFSNVDVYSNVNSRLSGYAEWCNRQTLIADGCNHFKEFMAPDFANYVNDHLERRKYLTRKEINEFIAKLDNPRDQFLVLCLFEIGKSPHFDDILKMQLSDIDKERGVVKLQSGREVKVSKDLIAKAEEANEVMVYYSPNGRKRKMESSPYIFKMCINANPDSTDVARANKMMTKLFSTLTDSTGIYSDINAASIAISGQFDMIARRSEELGMSKEEYIKKNFNELRAQYIMSPNLPGSFYAKYKAYL